LAAPSVTGGLILPVLWLAIRLGGYTFPEHTNGPI
jgi:hypothetical protein